VWAGRQVFLEERMLGIADGFASHIVVDDSGLGQLRQMDVIKTRANGFPISSVRLWFVAHDGIDEVGELGQPVRLVGQALQDVSPPPVGQHIEQSID
jgi:hypothetical protein